MTFHRVNQTSSRLSTLLYRGVAISTIATGVLVAGMATNNSFNSSPVSAYEIRNGQTIFTHSPRLIRSAASITASDAPSTYAFTVEVPANAGEPLKAVMITQESNVEQIKFDVSKSEAFMGDEVNGSSPITLASIGGESSDDKSVTVVFDRPVAPGSTVTVALKAMRNPGEGGIYQFGVMAYPDGNSSPGLHLGTARLQFSKN
jgi:hypothetical protein